MILPRCGTPGGLTPMPTHRKDGRPRQRNQQPATCNDCGNKLDTAGGVVERHTDGTWWTACAETQQ